MSLRRPQTIQARHLQTAPSKHPPLVLPLALRTPRAPGATRVKSTGTPVTALNVAHEHFRTAHKKVDYPIWTIRTFDELQNASSDETFAFKHPGEFAPEWKCIHFRADAIIEKWNEFLVSEGDFGPMRVRWLGFNLLDRTVFDRSKIKGTSYRDFALLEEEKKMGNNTFVCVVSVDVFSQSVRVCGTTSWTESSAIGVKHQPLYCTVVSMKNSKKLQDMLAGCPFYDIGAMVSHPDGELARSLAAKHETRQEVKCAPVAHAD